MTRHLADELARDDWTVLVLHYLGLDHIGHLEGPRSARMGPKLREMDDVVRTLWHGLVTQPAVACTHRRPLLVLLSDHGMTEAGNHGGASRAEREALALFAAPGWAVPAPSGAHWPTWHQIDVAPTLAALLGLVGPAGAIGRPITAVLRAATTATGDAWSPAAAAAAMTRAYAHVAGQLTRPLVNPDGGACTSPPATDAGVAWENACDAVRAAAAPAQDGAQRAHGRDGAGPRRRDGRGRRCKPPAMRCSR